MKTEAITENGSRYLLTSVNDQLFAIPSTAIVEIIHSSVPTRLPFVPRYIAGLVNVKGSVLALLNLSGYIYDDHAPRKQVFIVIESAGTNFLLAVDAAIDEIFSSNLKVNLYEAKALPGNSGNVQVAGEIDFFGEVAFILEMNQFNRIIPAATENRTGEGLLGKIHRQEENNEAVSLLVFQALGERFGFVLDKVVEIIEAETLIPIPGAPDCVLGVTTIRDDALLVLSFPVLLGRLQHSETLKNPLIVIERDSSLYAIDIAAFVNISVFLASRLKQSQNDNSLFSEVIIDNQDQVTVLVKNDELIPDDLHKKLKDIAPIVANKNVEEIHYRRVLHATINDLSYVFPLEDVRLVSPYTKIVAVNDSAKHIHGIIELEGRIISVLDASQHLGCIDMITAKPQYVIVGDSQSEWALPVTQVNEIIDIPELDIEKIVSGDLKHFSGIAHHHGQLIPLVNLKELYASEH